MINHDSLDQIPASDFDPGTVTFSVRGLILLVLIWMLLIGAGCALIFRWTNHAPEDTQYSKPLRTRPPVQPENQSLGWHRAFGIHGYGKSFRKLGGSDGK